MVAIRIPCRDPYMRHRWEWVKGAYATGTPHDKDGRYYVERRCRRCGQYESEIR